MVLAFSSPSASPCCFPLITALADPEVLTQGGLMGDLYDFSGATTVNGFVARRRVASCSLLFVIRIVLQITFLRWQTGVLAGRGGPL